MGLLTSGTCGPTCSTSSSSAALTHSLVNRLRRKTASGGTILFRLTWSEQATPSRRSISALLASAWTGGAAPMRRGWNGPYTVAPIPWLPGSFAILPVGLINLWRSAGFTSDNGNTLSGWPTPMAKEAGPDFAIQDRERSGSMMLPAIAAMTGWSTASARDWKDSEGDLTPRTMPNGQEKERVDQLPRQATLAGYPTPMAGTPAQNGNSGAGSTDSERKVEAMFGRDIAGSGVTTIPGLQPARLTEDGRLLTGSSAGMDRGGQLDPEHTRWLMRLPDGWESCAPTETASTLKRRRSSAGRSGK